MKIKIVSLAALLVFLCGCSGADMYTKFRDVADIEIIRTAAADADGDTVTVTAGTGLVPDGGAPKIYTAAGGSFGAAVGNLHFMSAGRETFFAHTENLLIGGKTAAESGISGILDYVMRETDMRIGVSVFVVRGASAADAVTRLSTETSSASDMLRFLKRNCVLTGIAYPVGCLDASKSLIESGCALIPAVELTPSGEISESGGDMLQCVGFGVLRGGRLAYYLTEDESRGAVLFAGKLEYEQLVVPDGEGRVTLGITKAKPSLVPKYENGRLNSVTVRLSAEASVVQSEGSGAPAEAESRERISLAAADILASQLRAAVARSQESGTDFLSLGAALKRQDPVKYSYAQPFDISELPVTVEVNCKTVRTFDIVSPLLQEG